MPGETNPEQIENFALKIIGAGPDRSERLDHRAAAIQTNFQPNPLFVADRKQVIDDFKPGLRRIPVHARDIGKKIEGAGGIILHDDARLADVVAIDRDCHLVAIKLHAGHGLGVPTDQSGDGGMVLQLLQIGDGRGQRH